MSSELVGGGSGSSSGSYSSGRVVGIPRRCWCGNKIVTKTSKTDANPYRRYYRCALAAVEKLSNDKHVFKWVDEAYLNEIEKLEEKSVVLEEELGKTRLVVANCLENEKKVLEKMETEFGEKILEMKKMVVAMVVVCIVGWLVKVTI